MTTPVEQQDADPAEVIDQQEDTGEMRVRLPVVVLEGVTTSDGRYLTPGGITHRALPLSLLACPENAHGGQDPAAAQVIGRIDSLTRHHGPDVVSPRTGEPFPEGVFAWSGEGAIQADHPIADLVRRRFLRGVSVDLAGMDVEMIGDDDALTDAEQPRRRMIAHSAEVAAVTLVAVPAFGDAYIELADQPDNGEAPVLTAAALPAWRSAEVGDYPALAAAAIPDGPMALVRWPANAAEVIAEWIAEGEGEQRDAKALAQHIADQVEANWAPDAVDDPDDELAAVTQVPGQEGSVGPSPAEYAKPHVYARDPQSGAGNCVCGAAPDDELHVGSPLAPVTASAETSSFAGHDLIFYKNRSTPKVVSRGAKSPDVPDSYGPVVSRRKATAEEERTIARGDWVRVDSSGKKPGESGYDKSKVRPNLSADLDDTKPGGQDQGGMGMPDAPQDCEAAGTGTYESEVGPHPAVRSLLYDDGRRYAATCDEHDGWAREQITEQGYDVKHVVEIAQPDTTDEEMSA